MNNLKDKVIIITGASKGIGRITAQKLSEYKPKLVLVSRNLLELEKVRETLDLDIKNVLLLEANIAIEKDCKHIIDETILKFGTIDILINNAAKFNRAKVIDLKVQDFDRVWNTNIRGAFMLTKFALQYMIIQNQGTILSVSSTAGKRGTAGSAAYTASKFALNGFMECLFREVREYNIRVIMISPSMVDTDVKREDEMETGGKGVYMRAEDVADTIVMSLNLPQRAMIKDIEIWGTNP
jgi:3-oxoacyl-[acyl-carrier protein] reductase